MSISATVLTAYFDLPGPPARGRRRFQVYLRQRYAGWQHGLGGRAPGEPCHLHHLRPEREWVGALDKTAERLEGGHSLQVYRYLLGITAR
jgi:hypothetical protein